MPTPNHTLITSHCTLTSLCIVAIAFAIWTWWPFRDRIQFVCFQLTMTTSTTVEQCKFVHTLSYKHTHKRLSIWRFTKHYRHYLLLYFELYCQFSSSTRWWLIIRLATPPHFSSHFIRPLFCLPVRQLTISYLSLLYKKQQQPLHKRICWLMSDNHGIMALLVVSSPSPFSSICKFQLEFKTITTTKRKKKKAF